MSLFSIFFSRLRSIFSSLCFLASLVRQLFLSFCHRISYQIRRQRWRDIFGNSSYELCTICGADSTFIALSLRFSTQRSCGASRTALGLFCQTDADCCATGLTYCIRREGTYESVNNKQNENKITHQRMHGGEVRTKRTRGHFPFEASFPQRPCIPLQEHISASVERFLLWQVLSVRELLRPSLSMVPILRWISTK